MYEVLKLGRLHNLTIPCQLDLFDKMVKPVLLYGCELWGYGNCDIITTSNFNPFKENLIFCGCRPLEKNHDFSFINIHFQ
jgi:hypothetical protein